MMSGISKVFIDSRFRTADSKSPTDFKFELTESIDLPDNCYAYIDDVIIPYTWYSIEPYNSVLYVQENNNGIIGNRILTLTTQNNTGVTLASDLQTQFNNAYGVNYYNVSFNTNRGTISIVSNNVNRVFKIFTYNELQTYPPNSNWNLPYNPNNLSLANDTFRLSTPMNMTTSYESGFVDLLNDCSLYLRSPNLSNFTYLGSRGECDIMKTIPVSASYGYMIIDTINTLGINGINISRLTLKTLEFKLTNSYSRVIDLHGSNISFSIAFVTKY